MNKELQVNVRMSPKEVELIDELINKGDFGTRSEFVRFAVRKVLKHYDKRIGFELPKDEE